MKVSKEEVEHIAALSMLRLNESETESMQTHLESVLALYSVISAVDTGDTPPTAHILPLKNVFRDDVAIAPACRETLLSMAPKSDGEAYIVPAVLD